MQLDLFNDNRRTIRLYDADQLLRRLDFEAALAIYDELLAEEPGDADLLIGRDQALLWRQRLATFQPATAESEQLYVFWLDLTLETPPSLATTLRERIVDELRQRSSPELIYVPPRFHIGTVLMEGGRCAEAEGWFARALEAGIEPRGRFLAWRGDALTRLDDSEGALSAYHAAFLQGPEQVELETLVNPRIIELLDSLESEDHDLNSPDLPAWLPVWGWLEGIFGLPLNDLAIDRARFIDDLEAAHASRSAPPARLWFDNLRYAEYLRTMYRDDKELVRVRRRMRNLNDFMFARYIEKIQDLC